MLLLVLAAALLLFIARGKSTSKTDELGAHTTLNDRPNVSVKRQSTVSNSERKEATTLTGSAYVIDGDTIVVCKTQMRLFGIDAPELNHPFGKKAKWALISLCKGQKIRADISELDCHGRTVAHCYLPDGRDLSAEMVKLGLAIDWPKFSGGKYSTLEQPNLRKKLWLADARQKGRMHVWEKYEVNLNEQMAKK